MAEASLARTLADWAHDFEPSPHDELLATRSLIDTLAVMLAARDHRVSRLTSHLDDGVRWAVAAHVLDFDDLHVDSTTHVSAVCMPATLASGGDARAYLAGAGAMARLGMALGWEHYAAGWHATCTAGAPAAAVSAAMAMGLSRWQTATAIALAVPGAGGVQRAFGSDAKSLQVGSAVYTGMQAAALAAAGANADLSAIDQWLGLVGGDARRLSLDGPAVPGGLAIKMYPCCYSMQRPIGAIQALVADGLTASSVDRVILRTLAATVTPLIHHRPMTGLEGKFSLEYAVATALLDEHPGFDAFTDDAVRRPEAVRLVGRVEVQLTPGGDSPLAGEFEAEVHTLSGQVLRTTMRYPLGSAHRPPDRAQFASKISDCLHSADIDPVIPATDWTWSNAAEVLRHAMVSPARSGA